LIQEALEDQSFLSTFHHVQNGAEAIQFLKKAGPYRETDTPDLILMDINMLVIDGHEALKTIKSTPSTKHIPVLILSTPNRKEDILKAYRGQTSSYFIKPDDIFKLYDLAEIIKIYWSNTATLPKNE